MNSIAIFLFYNESRKPNFFTPFSRYKHCCVILFKGDSWVLFKWGKKGLVYKILQTKSGKKILQSFKKLNTLISMVVVEINKPIEFPWRPLITFTCNEMCRYVSGIDVGFTVSPRHLYKKLLRYNKKNTNFKVIYKWMRLCYGEL